MILPSSKVIHSSLTFGQIDKNKKCAIYYRNITIVPIKAVLKKLLEIPNVFSTITTYIEQCKKVNTIISSIIQSNFGSLLKSLMETKLFYHWLYFSTISK